MARQMHEVFGPRAIFNKPKLGASCPLANLPKKKRFILFDDYRPVEYAALPRDNPTISCTTFLAMFQQQPFDVQVSQSFNDGHPEIVWGRGAAMTAKEEGLWEPMGLVTGWPRRAGVNATKRCSRVPFGGGGTV